MPIVIVNQASNYLTVGFANAFVQRGIDTTLFTGSVHEQGEALDTRVRRVTIARWQQRPEWRKALGYALSLAQTWCLLITRFRNHEVLFVSIPPMSYLLALLLPNRCSAIVWDVYPDILEVSGMTPRCRLYRLLAWLNRRALPRCDHVFTISEPMADLISKYLDRSRITVSPIWSVFDGTERVDPEDNAFLLPHRRNRFIVQYSGNIGFTHNVDALLDLAESLADDPRFLFQIIGRGPQEPQIRREAEKRKLANVEILPFQSDEMFPHSLSAADVGVVALDPRVSKGSVPSKTYNLMAFGIPALYIAAPDSELGRYANEFGTGQCFYSADVQEMALYLRRLVDDPPLYRRLSESATRAAASFSRTNADALVLQFDDSGGAGSNATVRG